MVMYTRTTRRIGNSKRSAVSFSESAYGQFRGLLQNRLQELKEVSAHRTRNLRETTEALLCEVKRDEDGCVVFSLDGVLMRRGVRETKAKEEISSLVNYLSPQQVDGRPVGKFKVYYERVGKLTRGYVVPFEI